MPEELLQFENTVEDEDGQSYAATVLGAEQTDGLWQGWIRFTDMNGHAILTDRETTQPNRKDLLYWSTGLTYAYLEGALERAKGRQTEPGRETGARSGEPETGARSGNLFPSTAGSARIVVVSDGGRIPERVLGTRTPEPGMSRRVPDAGFVEYEETRNKEGVSHSHFVLHYGSENAAALMANWLWSRLHDAGAEVRVNGAPVELRNDALKRAIVGV